MDKPPRPEYLPLSFDLAPNEPEGASTTFMIAPNVPGQRLEICGIATYDAPGECELLRISSGRTDVSGVPSRSRAWDGKPLARIRAAFNRVSGV